MRESTGTGRRSLLVICVTTAGWAFMFGVGTQALTLSMDALAWSDTLIGLNTGTYYLGIAVAALFVPAWLRRWGQHCAVAGMLLSGGVLLLYPLHASVSGWFVLRLLGGMAGALTLVPLETFISQDSAAGQRSRSFALYAVALTVGGALGMSLGLPLYQAQTLLPFLLGGGAAVLSGLALHVCLPAQTTALEEGTASPLDLTGNVLSYGSAWVQGFLEGGLVAFLPLYLLALGMSHNSAGALLGISLAGVIVFQIPVGWLADRLGRVPLLLGCHAVVIAGLLVVPLCEPGLALGCWLFLLGGSSGALYPLGQALLSERVAASQLSRAYAWFMAMECVGSITGPACMGQGRDWFGESAMFAVALLALAAVLLPWGVLWLSGGRRVAAVRAEQTSSQPQHRAA
jgi:MFS family permease